jgi:uridine kinase
MRTIKVLISGPHASGKSTLAKEILAKINTDEIGVLLNVDEVIALSTNVEIDETQDGLDLNREGRVRIR